MAEQSGVTMALAGALVRRRCWGRGGRLLTARRGDRADGVRRIEASRRQLPACGRVLAEAGVTFEQAAGTTT
jgi:hypothetical protein